MCCNPPRYVVRGHYWAYWNLAWRALVMIVSIDCLVDVLAKN